MQSIQTGCAFDLEQVKPLGDLEVYRRFSIGLLREALEKGGKKREVFPFSRGELKCWGSVDSMVYLSDAAGNLFLESLPEKGLWKALWAELNEYRHTHVLNRSLRATRQETIFEPKRDWIENSLELHGLTRPKVLEISLPHSEFSETLRKSSLFQEILWCDELDLTDNPPFSGAADAAVLLESLDRSADPESLLRNALASLKKGGLLFVTGLVASGFDFTVLGEKNAYLIPPDRTNCFTLSTLQEVLRRAGCQLLEVSTPGLLDVAVVKAHWKHRHDIAFSPFEKCLLESNEEQALLFQNFLQQACYSSYARLIARKG